MVDNSYVPPGNVTPEERIRRNCMAVIQKKGRRETAEKLGISSERLRKILGAPNWIDELFGLVIAEKLGISEDDARSADFESRLISSSQDSSTANGGIKAHSPSGSNVPLDKKNGPL